MVGCTVATARPSRSPWSNRLSDGLRNAIAMVADIAFRAYKLNPHFGAEAAGRTPGVALIDEVDMFLHPSWQQTIAGALLSAFPGIQFIGSSASNTRNCSGCNAAFSARRH